MTPRAVARRPLTIAYLVGAFPSPSETFVLNQIAGVAQRGHVVDIYTTHAHTMQRLPEPVTRLRLLQRCRRLDPGPARALAIARIVGLLLTGGWRALVFLRRALWTAKQDGGAGTLRLVYAALTLARLGCPRYDVIHAQFGPYGVLAMRLVQIGAISGAIVTSIRGYDAGKDLKVRLPVYRELFARGALFLPVSRTLAARLTGAGCDNVKVRVHHSGIAYRGWHYREQLPVAGEPVRLLTVARLVEKKGVAYALQAVARVRATGRQISYTVVGDGPLQQTLVRLARTLGIEAHVRLLGAQAHEDVRSLLHNSHILLAPSVTADDGDVEGIPNVVKEAMAVGLPVVGTQHGGIPELIEDGVSGLLVPERDADALARKLIELIDHPDRWPALSRVARRKVDGDFDIDRLNDELIDCYGRLAGVAPIADARVARVTPATAEARHA